MLLGQRNGDIPGPVILLLGNVQRILPDLLKTVGGQ